MKNPLYFKFMLILTFIAIVGCSKKEDPIVAPQEELILNLTSDAGEGELEVLTVDQVVAFQITGNDGEDYTSLAKIYVNDEEIPNASYTFSEPGTFEVKAVYESTASNILNFEVLRESDRALIFDINRAFRNQTITFGLLDSDGNNTASEATFFVNGTEISGFTFTSASPGEFKVYAEYIYEGEKYRSAVKTVSVFVPKKNIVLEDYTGTWCGFCLDAIVAVDSVKKLTEHVTVVAIHKKSGSFPEPLHFQQIEQLQEKFDVPNGFPQTQIDRTLRWNKIPKYDYEVIKNLAGKETNLSIAISSQIVNSKISMDIKVKYENGSEPGDKLVVYLLESGVIADQVNYFNNTPGHPYEGQGKIIKNFVHNEGLRNSLSNLFGDPIPQTTAFEEFKKSYTLDIPSNYVADNLSIAVMVVKADNAAKNSQHAKVGEDKDYK